MHYSYLIELFHKFDKNPLHRSEKGPLAWVQIQGVLQIFSNVFTKRVFTCPARGWQD